MIYLDNAATSFPKPKAVLDAMAGSASKLAANPGRSGHRMSLAAGRVIVNCRETLAQLLQVDKPEQIVFCFNCTDAINMAIHGLLQPGDHVITTAMDHNAVLRPLHGLQARGVISLDIITPEEDGCVTASQIENAFKPTTRLVVCTHASNVTGAIQPVEEIGRLCRKKGVYFLLDAAQTIGILPVHPKTLQADMVAFPGHKALLGPMGTGALWIREGIELTPFREGGTGSASESPYQPNEMPDRYESGTLNLIGIAGLMQGVRYVLARGTQIHQHEQTLSHRLLQGLSCIPFIQAYVPKGAHTGIVSFNFAGKTSGEIAELLDQKGFGVRAGLHCAPLAHKTLGTMDIGAVRVSAGFFNTTAEIDRLIDTLQQIASRI